MEISLFARNNLPNGGIVSIRAGTVRRQVAVSDKRPFRFPSKPTDSLLQVEVFKPVGTAYLVLRPGEHQYKVSFGGMEEVPMSCTVHVKPDQDSLPLAAEEEIQEPSPSAEEASVPHRAEPDAAEPDSLDVSRRSISAADLLGGSLARAPAANSRSQAAGGPDSLDVSRRSISAADLLGGSLARAPAANSRSQAAGGPDSLDVSRRSISAADLLGGNLARSPAASSRGQAAGGHRGSALWREEDEEEGSEDEGGGLAVRGLRGGLSVPWNADGDSAEDESEEDSPVPRVLRGSTRREIRLLSDETVRGLNVQRGDARTSQTEHSSQGASPGYVDALPEHTVTAEESRLPPEGHRGCAICMEDFREGDVQRTLPCFHRYHRACVDQWLAQQAACPVCKHRVEEGAPEGIPAAPKEGREERAA